MIESLFAPADVLEREVNDPIEAAGPTTLERASCAKTILLAQNNTWLRIHWPDMIVSRELARIKH